MKIDSFFKYLWVAALGLFFMTAAPLHALDSKQTKKVMKECGKMCKQLKKEGWKVYGKAQQIDDALAKHYIALEEGGDSLQSLVVTAEGKDINQARSKAQLNASNQLASMRESQVESTTDVRITNEESSEGVKSTSSMDNSSTLSVNQRVKSLVPGLTLSRTNADGKVEVQMYFLVKP